MNNRYAFPVFFFFLSLFSHQNLSAQNLTITINGEQVVCAGNCFTLTATVSGSPAAGFLQYWKASGPNNYSTYDTTKSITRCLQLPGTYTFYAVVTTDNGTSATAFFNVTVLPYTPVQIISGNLAPCNFDSSAIGNQCEKVCPNTTVTYSIDQSSPNPGGSQPPKWTVNGAASYIVNPPFGRSVTVTWGGPGTGSVQVQTGGIGTTGCIGEDAVCVTIIAQPNAQIAATPAPSGGVVQVCKGQTVYFQNQSTGADFYEWSFSDDASSSPSADAKHTYQTPGTYTVTLVARSACLCADTTTLQVQVLDAQSPALDCVGTICPGETVTYTASNGCAPFTWSVSSNGSILDGGTSTSDSIKVSWTTGPSGVITLGAQPCTGAACPLPAQILVPIISDEAEIRGKERVCPGAEEEYSIDPFGGTNFIWKLSGGGSIQSGQGTNSVVVQWQDAASPGAAFILSVEYESCYLGCKGRDSIGVRVLSPFVVNGPVEICEGANGTFTSKLTSTFQNINCVWTVIAPGGAPGWSGVGGSVNPPFTSGAGIYRLLAVPVDPNQTCSEQADWAVTAPAKPTKPAGILGEKNICPNTAYTYEVKGVSPQNRISWSVQNGPGAAIAQNGNPLNITWGSSGPRSLVARLISTDGLGCQSDTVRLNIAAIGSPTVSGKNIVCEDAKATYTLGSLQNVDIQWKIVPATAGAVVSGQGASSVEIFWSQPGGHSVQVDVCGQSAIYPVTVLATPDPMVMHPTGLCKGSTGTVQTTASFSQYTWKDINGTVLSTAPTPALTSGSYAVQVSDANGCIGTEIFTIEPSPDVNVSLTTADPTGFCNNSRFVTLTALTNADGNLSYQWFQNGTPLPGATGAAYATNQYGNYTVIATNAQGCSAQAGPILLFNYCGGGGGGQIPGGGDFCPPGTIDIVTDPNVRCDSFQFHVQDASGLYTPGSAQWQFFVSGGNVLGTSKDEDPSFVFPNAGKYVIALIVQLTNGATCLVIDSVRVAAKAQFKYDLYCAGEQSNFQDISTFLPGGGVAGWQWNFGDPSSGGNNTASINNPSHVFSSTGKYTVKLVVSATSGCTSESSLEVEIPTAVATQFAPPAATCAGNALEFAATLDPSVTELSWDFGDPASGAANDATGSLVYHNFSPPGTYTVRATTTNAYGCTAAFSRTITIAPNALTGNINPSAPPAVCEGKTVTLTAPPGGVSYLWSDSSKTTTQVLTIGKEGTYRVTLTDASGCTYAPPPVNVDILTAPNATVKALIENDLGQVIGVSYPTLTTCFGVDVHLAAFTNGANYGYSWSGGNGTQDEIFFTDDRGNLLPVGTHTYSVTVTDISNGCTAVTPPFIVTVNPVPTGFSISANGLCGGNPTTLTYAGPTPGNWQYIWNTGVLGTTLVTEQPGKYQIRVINQFGCEAKSNQLILKPGPNVAAIPSGCHARCKPDSLCLPNIPGIVSWQWFKDGQPVPGGNSEHFVAQESGTYWAELVDNQGCKGTSDPLTLTLFDGYGNIAGQVWSDVNKNGVIDGSDTLLPGIAVRLLRNALALDTLLSGNGGSFVFSNILSTDYTVQLLADQFGPNWKIVIGQSGVKLVGCDALGISNLLVQYVCPFRQSSLALKACPGGAALYNGQNIPTGTSKIFTFKAPDGCDSTVTVTVSAQPISIISLALRTCPGTTLNYNGTALAIGQTKSFVLKSVVTGCDSIVNVSVAALPTSTGSLTLKTCPGTTASYNGTPIAIGATQKFTLKNYLGCDSVLTVSVSALPTSSKSIELKACPGATASYNGAQIAIGTTQNFTFKNYLGCDSIVTVSVSALPVSAKSVALKTCPGSMAIYNGTQIPIGATQSFTFKNYLGCDSTVTVTVAALPSSSSSLTLKTCPGTPIVYANTALKAGDVKAFVLKNYLDCDSTVTVTVVALPVSTHSVSLKTCPGTTVTYANTALKAGDVKQFVFKNYLGCDSTVTVSVAASQTSAKTLDVQVCPGETYVYSGATLKPGETRNFTLINAEGCDSIVTVKVSAFPSASFALVSKPSCATLPNGSLTISGPMGGLAPYRYSLDGVKFQDELIFKDLGADAYTVWLEDSNGCLFQQAASIAALARLDVTLLSGVLPCDSTAVRLEPIIAAGDTAGLTYTWHNGAKTPFIIQKEAATVWVELKNQCETVRREASVSWAELPSDFTPVYVPNVVMPDSRDPDNYLFRPFFAAGLTLLDYHLEVFDRWGNLMFRTNQIESGWGGEFRKEDMNPGVYVWYLQAHIALCGRVVEIKREGDVTVVR